VFARSAAAPAGAGANLRQPERARWAVIEGIGGGRPGTRQASPAYPRTMDDEALLERSRHGDRDAFAALVNRYQDELYTMALRLLDNPADAADVVQETFLRAYTHLPELRGTTARGWLYRVAVNCSHDVQRRAIRRPADPLEDAEGKIVDLPDPALGPEGSTLQRERVAALGAALQSVPSVFRIAVVLRDVNDLTYEEISEALRVPVGTVRSRLNRGRTMLATALRSSSLFARPLEGNG
jgi:RNA polymerase sigma-70 factor, ECF subfamily